MKQINIKQSIKEYNIAGDVFTLSLSDEALKGYMDGIKELQAVSIGGNLDVAKKQSIKMINLLFNEEDAGNKVYKLVGESTYILVDVLNQIVDDLSNEIESKRANKIDEYLGDL